jgi:hypothetical protein
MISEKVVETEMHNAVKGKSESFITVFYAGTISAPFVALHTSQ